MNKTIKDITLLGYYGRQNSGDDAMLYGMLALLHEALPTAKLNVPTNNSDICIPPDTYDKVDFFPRQLGPILGRIASSDAVIIGGGTILHDYSHRLRYHWTLIRYFGLILWAKIWGKKVYMVGVGFGPFTTTFGRILARGISRLVDYMTVRDSTSQDYLVDIGMPKEKFHLTFDLACILHIKNPLSSPTTPVLGVSILPFFWGYTDDQAKDIELANVLASALSSWLRVNPHGKIHLLTFLGREEGDGDLSMIWRVINQMENSQQVEIIPYSSDPHYLIQQVQKCTAVITMRYHAAVYAYMTQRPMLVVNYHPKCEAFSRDINYADSYILTIDQLMMGELLQHLGKLSEPLNPYRGSLDLSQARRLARRALPPMLYS